MHFDAQVEFTSNIFDKLSALVFFLKSKEYI